MKTIKLRLDSIKQIKEFVNLISRYSFDADLISGRYTIDAKSIMGIFSLDLSEPLEMMIHNDDCGELLKALEAYRAK